MVQCFVPDCNHQSEAQDCSFFRFPGCEKERKRWEKLISGGVTKGLLHLRVFVAAILEMAKKLICQQCLREMQGRYLKNKSQLNGNQRLPQNY